MANDYPQIVDKSTLTGVFNVDQFLAIGIEGQADAAGSATVALPYVIASVEDANAIFGPVSRLTGVIKLVLARGINFVYAVASAKAAGPTLVQRQTAWANLEANADIRIRLTDSETQADLVALADSCEWAETIQNKQFCIVGLAGPAVKATSIAAATALASKRGIIVDPGIYDVNGVLLTGRFAAAAAACEIAKNPDITDSLNKAPIPATTGIEKEAASGLPVYRLKANAGTPINDFQDLLTGGVSPFETASDGRAAFSHLRTTWTTDTSFDALQTLLIKDQVFIDIRNLLLGTNALRTPNTADNRSLAAKIVERYLKSHDDWVAPVKLGDGTTGYGVTVVTAPDLKSFTVNYFGAIVRGTNVININGTLTIPA